MSGVGSSLGTNPFKDLDKPLTGASDGAISRILGVGDGDRLKVACTGSVATVGPVGTGSSTWSGESVEPVGVHTA